MSSPKTYIVDFGEFSAHCFSQGAKRVTLLKAPDCIEVCVLDRQGDGAPYQDAFATFSKLNAGVALFLVIQKNPNA